MLRNNIIYLFYIFILYILCNRNFLIHSVLLCFYYIIYIIYIIYIKLTINDNILYYNIKLKFIFINIWSSNIPIGNPFPRHTSPNRRSQHHCPMTWRYCLLTPMCSQSHWTFSWRKWMRKTSIESFGHWVSPWKHFVMVKCQRSALQIPTVLSNDFSCLQHRFHMIQCIVSLRFSQQTSWLCLWKQLVHISLAIPASLKMHLWRSWWSLSPSWIPISHSRTQWIWSSIRSGMVPRMMRTRHSCQQLRCWSPPSSHWWLHTLHWRRLGSTVWFLGI